MLNAAILTAPSTRNGLSAAIVCGCVRRLCQTAFASTMEADNSHD